MCPFCQKNTCVCTGFGIARLLACLFIDLLQCPANTCWFRSNDSLCSSRCLNADCGATCTASPISSWQTLQQNSLLGCEILLGDLTITSLPPDVDESLLSALSTITAITGTLRILCNPNLVSLVFLSRLQSVGSLQIADNPNLVDARLPSLAMLPHDWFFHSNPKARCFVPSAPAATIRPYTSRCSTVDLVMRIAANNSLAGCAPIIRSALALELQVPQEKVSSPLSSCTTVTVSQLNSSSTVALISQS